MELLEDRPPAGAIAQPDRLRPHLRATIERRPGLARDRDDVVERRLVLAADRAPEVRAAIRARLGDPSPQRELL